MPKDEMILERFNKLDKLDFLIAGSPDELRNMLRQIRKPTEILSISPYKGTQLIAWFFTEAVIVKIKETKNG